MNRLVTSAAIPARAVKIEALANMTGVSVLFLGCWRFEFSSRLERYKPQRV